MTFCVENETDLSIPLNTQELFEAVAVTALNLLQCPYETEINLFLVDNEEIQEINKSYRSIDSATDVLSFPLVSFETLGDFSRLETECADCFHPDTGELMLGDIIISIPKVFEQAEHFNHGIRREFAFLIAHSMLHLCGYDHISPIESEIMESMQRKILDTLQIIR